MRSYKIEGIIIGRRNFSETDRVITILTKSQGKQIFLAKGVRKITSQRGPRIEMFNYIGAQIHRGKTWDILGEVNTIRRFDKLKKSLARVGAGYEVCELVDRLIPENDPLSELLPLVLGQFNRLNQSGSLNIDKLLFNFKTRLLVITGFWPEDQKMTNQETNHFIENLIHAKIKSKSLRMV
ncbi:MAG: DNA repair protein RecO [Candidatus Shapirobacteria bacterium]|nr:DNA repair protein RecO [Candidatus Shapirobacteria bacterium]MDD5074059.1 DNA repair protein RecO [Candidatus Shapirobacteria bacterium]MDD5481687.1 DNA repair protein RecO [Candidatus Shapirobacteria bacterium]